MEVAFWLHEIIQQNATIIGRPPGLYIPLLSLFNRTEFNIDVCCNQTNIPANFYFFERVFDGLKEGWHGLCFMNPPFKYAQKWVIKAFTESHKLLYPALTVAVLPADRTETKYYQEYILNNELCVFAFLPGKYGFIIPGHEDEGIIPSVKILIAIFCRNQNDVNHCLRRWNKSGAYIFNTPAFQGGGINV